jgi:hypothetical protein
MSVYFIGLKNLSSRGLILVELAYVLNTPPSPPPQKKTYNNKTTRSKPCNPTLPLPEDLIWEIPWIFSLNIQTQTGLGASYT